MTTAEAALTPGLPTAQRRRAPFDRVTIALHWTTVLLVLGLFAVGWSMSLAPDAATAGLLLTIHRTLGVSVWTLTAGRAVWRRTGARLPPFPASMPPIQRLAARLNEYGLYALLLAQPVTGALQSVYRGKAFALFLWQVPTVVGRDKALVHLFHQVHEWGAWALVGLIGMHAGAALLHGLVLRDGVFESMAPIGRRGR